MDNKDLKDFKRRRTLINNMYNILKKDSLESYLDKYAGEDSLLKNILTFCYEYEINIHSYSLGSDHDPAYINFKYDLVGAYCLSSLVAKLQDEEFSFIYIKESKNKLALQIESYQNKTTFFEKIYEALIDDTRNMELPADLDCLEHIFLEDNFDLPLELAYKKEDGKYFYSILTKIPHYVEYAKNMQFKIEETNNDFTSCLLMSNSQSIASLKLRHFFDQIRILNLNYDSLISLISKKIIIHENLSKNDLVNVYKQFLKEDKSNNTIALYHPVTDPKSIEILFIHNNSTNKDDHKIIFSDAEIFKKEIFPSLLMELKKDLLLLNDHFDDFSSNLKNNFYEATSIRNNKFIFGNLSQSFIRTIDQTLRKEEKTDPVVVHSKRPLPSSAGYTSPTGLIIGTAILSLSVLLFALMFTLLK